MLGMWTSSGSAVLIVVDPHLDDLLGGLECVFLVELDVGRAGDLRLLTGGHQVGVELLRHRGQTLEHALDVDDHQFDGAGQERQLLVEAVACRRNAAAHPDLVGGTADAAQRDPVGALALGVFDHLRVLRCVDDQLGERRLVAVDDDVDLIVLEDAQVRLAGQRPGGAPDDVGEVGGQHGAAPPGGQAQADGLLHEVVGVLVASAVGAVHGVDHFAVETARADAQLVPQLLALLGSAIGVRLVALLAAPVVERGRQLPRGPAAGRPCPRCRC